MYEQNIAAFNSMRYKSKQKSKIHFKKSESVHVTCHDWGGEEL